MIPRPPAPPCGLLLALALAALPADGQAQSSRGGLFSFVGVTSDYRYQGVSNSDGQPALQASLHWWRPDGLYLGAFATQVAFNDPGDTSYELDIYGGRNFDLKDGKTRLTLETMFTAFPNEHVPGPTYNFVQFKAAARRTEGPLSVAAITSFVPEASYGAGEAWRLEGEAAYAFSPAFRLTAGLGRRWVEHGQDRTYWSLGAGARWRKLSFELRYEDTDLSRAECGHSDRCAATVVGTVRVDLPPAMLSR